MNCDYELKFEELKLDLKRIPSLKEIVDLEPEEIALCCQVIIAEQQKELDDIEHGMKHPPPKYLKMMESDKEVKQIKILQTNLEAAKLI